MEKFLSLYFAMRDAQRLMDHQPSQTNGRRMKHLEDLADAQAEKLRQVQEQPALPLDAKPAPGTERLISQRFVDGYVKGVKAGKQITAQPLPPAPGAEAEATG